MAAAQVLAGVGVNILSQVIGDSITALRRRTNSPGPEDVERELSERIVKLLDVGNAESERLRAEIARLLREIDAAGKSTLGSAAGRLLPPSADLRSGDIAVLGESLAGLSNARIRQVRRERLGFVFQDPIGALDPTMRIGRQMRLAQGDRGSIRDQLERVRLNDPERVMRAFPHQLSGGMAQRVGIAMALSARPRLLVADEPTAALDSQIRQDVLDTVFALAAEAGTGILLLTHDLSAVSRRCSRMAVMYGGRVVEDGPTAAVLNSPLHPYTAALARSVPGNTARGERLESIPGRPPVLTSESAGCAFAARCAFAENRCRNERPVPTQVDGRTVLCHRVADSTFRGWRWGRPNTRKGRPGARWCMFRPGLVRSRTRGAVRSG